MEFHFSAEEWSRLTLEKRVKYCTIMAEESQKLASQADKKLKALYMDLTLQWLTLATELSKTERREDEKEP